VNQFVDHICQSNFSIKFFDQILPCNIPIITALLFRRILIREPWKHSNSRSNIESNLQHAGKYRVVMKGYLAMQPNFLSAVRSLLVRLAFDRLESNFLALNSSFFKDKMHLLPSYKIVSVNPLSMKSPIVLYSRGIINKDQWRCLKFDPNCGNKH
jgi:hypothetical protein